MLKMKIFEFNDLNVPIIQAPMAGGINTPELVSTVANFGGVGSFGFAYTNPEGIEKSLQTAKKLTAGYINANFFVFKDIELPEKETQKKCLEALTSLPFGEQVEFKIPSAPFFISLDDQLGPVWDYRPAIVTFHLGIPNLSIIEKAKSLGIKVGITATNEIEAIEIVRAGADFIVAQGFEAGGHRGVFDVDKHDYQLKLDDLLIKLTKKIALPIVAAGGLMTGADIRRVINLGAKAAQMGTAFLCSTEAGTSTIHREYLLNNQDRVTKITNAFSGRPARGIDNTFIKIMKNGPTLPFPAQNSFTASLRMTSEVKANGEFVSHWAGENFKKIRNLSCSQILQELKRELENIELKLY